MVDVNEFRLTVSPIIVDGLFCTFQDACEKRRRKKKIKWWTMLTTTTTIEMHGTANVSLKYRLDYLHNDRQWMERFLIWCGIWNHIGRPIKSAEWKSKSSHRNPNIKSITESIASRFADSPVCTHARTAYIDRVYAAAAAALIHWYNKSKAHINYYLWSCCTFTHLPNFLIAAAIVVVCCFCWRWKA